MTAPQDPGELLLHLYRFAHEHSIDAFQDAALQLLQSAVPFDAAMWGTAGTTPVGIDVHTLHLFRKSPEMMAATASCRCSGSASARKPT